MKRDTAIGLLGRLHKAQNEFYAGRSCSCREQLLAPNVTCSTDLTWPSMRSGGSWRRRSCSRATWGCGPTTRDARGDNPDHRQLGVALSRPTPSRK
jgi:hypothetical protein